MNIAVILSGGTGLRLGSDIPKQYIKVNGKMIIDYCLETFSEHSLIDGIWVVCADEWRHDITSDCIMGFSNPGINRQMSIYNALTDIRAAIPTKTDPLIIIHDAARPNITEEYITRCIEAVQGHDGLMPALPMKDTVYYSEDANSISKLLDRGKIFAGQAPELYYLNRYLEANTALLPDKILNINGTTEPAILYGLDVVMIPGDENNYKITTPADLERFKGQL